MRPSFNVECTEIVELELKLKTDYYTRPVVLDFCNL